MKIAVYFDIRYTTRPQATGVDKHIESIVSRLRRVWGSDVCALLAQDQADGQEVGSNSRLAGLPVHKLPLTNKMARVWWGLFNRPGAERWCRGVDWVYCPQELFAPTIKARSAVTIHGLTFFEKSHPDYHTWRFRWHRLRLGWFLKRVCRTADLVLPVSQYLEDALVAGFGLDRGKSVVVGNGVDELFFADFNTQAESYEPNHILVIGGLNGWDGAEHILNVAEALQKELPNCRMRIAGNMNEEPYLSRARSLQNVELVGFLPPQDLLMEMRSALALLYLPNVESFGIAGLEAMAAGLPVIACKLTAVPQTLGNAAYYVDVQNPSESITAIKQLQQNPTLRSNWVEKGRQHASGETWDACAERVIEALKNN